MLQEVERTRESTDKTEFQLIHTAPQPPQGTANTRPTPTYATEIFEEPNLVGVSIARRKAIDMLSIWNSDSSNPEVHFGIGEKLKEVLDLGPDTLVEYKLFNAALSDGSTFRNAKSFVFAPAS